MPFTKLGPEGPTTPEEQRKIIDHASQQHIDNLAKATIFEIRLAKQLQELAWPGFLASGQPVPAAVFLRQALVLSRDANARLATVSAIWATCIEMSAANTPTPAPDRGTTGD